MFRELMKMRTQMRNAGIEMRNVLPFAINSEQANELLNAISPHSMRFTGATKLEVYDMKFIVVEDNGYL